MPSTTARDPWLTAGMPHERLLAEAERDMLTALGAAQHAFLNECRRAVLHTNTTAAVRRERGITVEGWPSRERWAELLSQHVLPTLRRWYRRIFGRIYDAAPQAMSEWEREYLEHFATDPWPDRLYEQAAEELDDSIAAGDPLELQRERLDLLLRMTAPVRRIRERIAEYRRNQQKVPDGVWELAEDEETHRNEARQRARFYTVGTYNRATLDAGNQMSRDTGQALFKRWMSTHDERVRNTHWIADKQSVPMGATFRVGRGDLRYPGDPLGPIEEIANCRCALAIDDEEESAQMNAEREQELPYRTDPDGQPIVADAADTDLPDSAAAEALLDTEATTDNTPSGHAESEAGPSASTEAEGLTAASQRSVARTKGGNVKQSARDKAAAEGHALPDGSYPINTVADLRNAIQAFGRAKNPEKVKAHIIKRARALGRSDLIPDSWKRRGTTTADGGDSRPWAERVADAVPLEPPSAWFDNPELERPTKVTVTEEGRVIGHIATWNTDHISYPGRRVRPPRSQTNYAHFRRHPVRTADGQRILAGALVMGTGHADLDVSASAAEAHYDHTGHNVADVVAGEDEHGIWISGALRPGVTPLQVLTLDRYSLSGDWRNGELVAALSVNVPGFPIPNGEESIALAACGSPLPVAQLDYHCDTHGDVVAVVASGVLAPTRTAAQTAPGNTTDLARELLRQMREIERAERIVTAAARRVCAPLVADAVQRVHGDTELDDALTLAAPYLEHLTAADNGGHGYDPEEFDELDAQDHQLIRQITDTNSSLDDDDGGGDEQGTTTAAAKKRKNWVDKQGGLPSYVKRIAKHLKAKGMNKSRSIATAINVVKKMCRGGDKLNFPGVQSDVNKGSVAQACAAVARWNAMKAREAAD